MSDIDLALLRRLEGFGLTGYVPTHGNGLPLGKSGVTIAMGVDIGQMDANQIRDLAIPGALKAKLLPYCAPARGGFALSLLKRDPLNLSPAEADALDVAVMAPELKRLGDAYNEVTLPVELLGWDAIPPAARSVMASVMWQYGNLAAECPKFWRACCTQYWEAVVKLLLDFGDAYPTRRCSEAVYLAAALNLPIGEAHP